MRSTPWLLAAVLVPSCAFSQSSMEALSLSGRSLQWSAPAPVPAVGKTGEVKPYEPIDGLSTPWLRAAYEDGLRVKAGMDQKGMCRSAQAVYRFSGYGRQIPSDHLFVLGMEAIKKTMAETIARDYPEGETGLKVIIAGRADASKPANTRYYVNRVVEGDSVANALIAHAEEFVRPAKRALVHSDTAYARKASGDSEVLSSVINFLVFVDMERGELALLGTGDCGF